MPRAANSTAPCNGLPAELGGWRRTPSGPLFLRAARLPDELPVSVPERRVVVIIDLSVAGSVIPVPVSISTVLGSTLELIDRDAGAVPAEPGVIFQRRPGHGVVVFTDAEKTAK